MLPNVNALIRRAFSEPKLGLVINKDLGKIKSIVKGDDDKFTFSVEYPDGNVMAMDLDEVTSHVKTYGSELRKSTAKSILGAYDYTESRLTGRCASPYNCTHSYLICELSKMFDPSFVAENAAKIDAA